MAYLMVVGGSVMLVYPSANLGSRGSRPFPASSPQSQPSFFTFHVRVANSLHPSFHTLTLPHCILPSMPTSPYASNHRLSAHVQQPSQLKSNTPDIFLCRLSQLPLYSKTIQSIPSFGSSKRERMRARLLLRYT